MASHLVVSAADADPACPNAKPSRTLSATMTWKIRRRMNIGVLLLGVRTAAVGASVIAFVRPAYTPSVEKTSSDRRETKERPPAEARGGAWAFMRVVSEDSV